MTVEIALVGLPKRGVSSSMFTSVASELGQEDGIEAAGVRRFSIRDAPGNC